MALAKRGSSKKNGRKAPVSLSNSNENTEVIVPFLKWAGGKRWLAHRMKNFAPVAEGKYYEPFLGSGAIFFHLQPKRAVLNDVNKELVNAYKVIKKSPAKLMEMLKQHHDKHSSKYYYNVRESTPTNQIRRAARFIYLNRTCWNGLYRVNKKGDFNVPIGTKSKVVLESDDFAALSKKLRTAAFHTKDFATIMKRAGKDDLIFADPPYTVNHNLNGFLKYNEDLFSWDDQKRLHDAAVAAAKRGAYVVISNANHASIKQLYKEKLFSLQAVRRYSKLSGSNEGRKRITELVIIARPK